MAISKQYIKTLDVLPEGSGWLVRLVLSEQVDEVIFCNEREARAYAAGQRFRFGPEDPSGR